MPGPARFFGAHLAEAVRARRGRRAGCLDARPRALLGVFDRLGALDDPPRARGALPRTGPSTARSRARRRPASMVLLRNDGVLPLDAGRAALAGRDRPERRPRRSSWAAARPSCAPHYRVSPLDALARAARRRRRDRTSGAASIDRTVPELAGAVRLRGVRRHELAGEPVRRAERQDGNLMFWRSPSRARRRARSRCARRGRFTPSDDGPARRSRSSLAGTRAAAGRRRGRDRRRRPTRTRRATSSSAWPASEIARRGRAARPASPSTSWSSGRRRRRCATSSACKVGVPLADAAGPARPRRAAAAAPPTPPS